MPVIRSRDLRANIKEWGFERGVVLTVEQLLDEYAMHRQHMRELTELVSQCVGQIERFVTIGDGMKRDIERINRERKSDDDGSASRVPSDDGR